MKVHCSLKQAAEDKEDPSVSKRTEFYVDPETLVLEEGYNLRRETKALRESIQQLKIAYINGATFPAIDVEMVNGKRVVRDGHRRTRAVLEAIAEGIRRGDWRRENGGAIVWKASFICWVRRMPWPSRLLRRGSAICDL
ncbi:hypothetical protein [Burkholderia contaminans]|uniref:hypothetical protein n=1 Tax=Burkholderia contaminans TaxID=488447 RepID=UPI001188A39D|nr:hypothetical protein [Burkholderia contaminans]QDS32454.1 hypothetical protein FPQ37_41835 [Burkholderia contaminans]